jgi:hypothetical protein
MGPNRHHSNFQIRKNRPKAVFADSTAKAVGNQKLC